MEIKPQLTGIAKNLPRLNYFLATLIRVVSTCGIAGGSILLAFGFHLIYDCPGLADFDLKELKYGVAFVGLGLPVFLVALLGVTCSERLRCLGITIFLVTLAFFSLWRFQNYKKRVCILATDTEIVFTKDMVLHHNVYQTALFKMRKQDIRPAHWYETGFAIKVGPKEYRVPLKYVPGNIRKMKLVESRW